MADCRFTRASAVLPRNLADSIIPAVSFDEPNWESRKNIWLRFRRADGAPWGLAGLWNTWTNKTTAKSSRATRC